MFNLGCQAAGDWNRHPYCLTFIELEGAMHTTGGGGKGAGGGWNRQFYPAVNPTNYENHWPGKHAHWCNSNTNVMEVTNHSLTIFKSHYAR